MHGRWVAIYMLRTSAVRSLQGRKMEEMKNNSHLMSLFLYR